MQKVKSLIEARKEFSTQIKCEDHLAKMRWPNGVECPRCGSKAVTRLSTRRKWQCKKCRYQFSVTAGTIFHKSHIDLPRWMMAVWLMCHSPKGVSSKQIERELGVTYKTAWYMTQRIRTAMKHDIFEKKLCGIVEVDEAVVKADGGAAKGHITYDAKNVFGMAERDGLLRMVVVDTLKIYEIKRVLAKNLGEVQAIYSDATKKLRFLSQFAPHRYVAHAYDEYVLDDVHVNTIESAWSLFKRGLAGVFHHVNAKYLQDYLDEFAFRYSHRHERHRLMDLALASC